MGLIDADALSKLVGEPIEVFLRRLDLKLPPIVDAVEVVRCKDCKYASLTYDGECKYCQRWKEKYDGESTSLYLDGDFYCAFGEREEDELLN